MYFVKLDEILINRVCKDYEETYYTKCIHPHMRKITDKLSGVINWLFTTYGNINRYIPMEKSQKVLDIFYDFQSPITGIFEPIRELEQLEIGRK